VAVRLLGARWAAAAAAGIQPNGSPPAQLETAQPTSLKQPNGPFTTLIRLIASSFAHFVLI